MKNGNPDVVVVGGNLTGLLTAGASRRRGLGVRLGAIKALWARQRDPEDID
jgi:NADPH-dependent 2,4-dienoyl-CoA reductase/sulfur reductase-like enzyme